MSDGFQRTLARIRSAASSPAEQGTLFERLMKQYFRLDPRYCDQFPGVWRGSDWAALRPDFARQDTGADLVVEERGSGFSAIQCKFHGPGTQITKQAFDSFISASARDPFTRRIVVDTGDAWGRTPHQVAGPGTRQSRGVVFARQAGSPATTPTRRDRGRAGGFPAVGCGKLIMACGTGKTFIALRITEGVGGGGRVVRQLHWTGLMNGLYISN